MSRFLPPLFLLPQFLPLLLVHLGLRSVVSIFHSLVLVCTTLSILFFSILDRVTSVSFHSTFHPFPHTIFVSSTCECIRQSLDQFRVAENALVGREGVDRRNDYGYSSFEERRGRFYSSYNLLWLCEFLSSTSTFRFGFTGWSFCFDRSCGLTLRFGLRAKGTSSGRSRCRDGFRFG